MGRRLSDDESAALKAMLGSLVSYYGYGAEQKIAHELGTLPRIVSRWKVHGRCNRPMFDAIKRLLRTVRKDDGVYTTKGTKVITRAEAKAISDMALNPPPPTDADVVEWLTDIDEWIRREAAHGETKLNWVTTPKWVHGGSDNENHRRWGRLLAPMLVKELKRLGYKAEADVESYYPSIKVEWG